MAMTIDVAGHDDYGEGVGDGRPAMISTDGVACTVVGECAAAVVGSFGFFGGFEVVVEPLLDFGRYFLVEALEIQVRKKLHASPIKAHAHMMQNQKTFGQAHSGSNSYSQPIFAHKRVLGTNQ